MQYSNKMRHLYLSNPNARCNFKPSSCPIVCLNACQGITLRCSYFISINWYDIFLSLFILSTILPQQRIGYWTFATPSIKLAIRTRRRRQKTWWSVMRRKNPRDSKSKRKIRYHPYRCRRSIRPWLWEWSRRDKVTREWYCDFCPAGRSARESLWDLSNMNMQEGRCQRNLVKLHWSLTNWANIQNLTWQKSQLNIVTLDITWTP